ncbi:MAGE family-domain-containing protein [Tricladium varicosporioides]|nr:MAGE family-domain-containing protein [Hymenoscyphus varicosporioides]
MPSVARRRRPVQEEEEEEEEVTQSTQRGRIRGPVSEDESEEEDDENEGDGMEVDGEEDSPDAIVKKLVRYALACEFQRTTIKRVAIREKVLGKQKGPFKPIFDAAQKQLRSKFGMEMIELPGREKTSIQAKRAAAKSKSGGSSKPTSSYIVVTTLPPAYRIPEIIAPSLSGSDEDEAVYVGLCTVIVSYISMSPEGSLPDHKFMKMLSRLNIEHNTPLDKTEIVLKKMIAQGYIYKDVDRSADEETIDWRVGPRGKVEIGNRAIQGFVKQVYGDDAPEDLDKRIYRSLNMDVTKIDQIHEDPAAAQDANSSEPGPSTARTLGRRRRAAADDDSDD